jgi:hypothetical protein
VVTRKIWHSGPGEGRLKGVRGHQDTSLDALLEAAILDKVERAAEVLSSGREVMDAKQAADYLRISESEFKRMAPGLPRHAVTERRFIYLRSELLAWLTGR